MRNNNQNNNFTSIDNRKDLNEEVNAFPILSNEEEECLKKFFSILISADQKLKGITNENIRS
jgi:hypothetical protein